MRPINQKLKEILDKFKEQIKPEEFEYTRFVTEFDDNLNCGTVCCIAGWFPKMFPESNFYWKEHELFVKGKSDYGNDTKIIDLELREMIGTKNQNLIEYLFYGEEMYAEEEFPLSNIHADYDDVVESWEWVIENYEGD